MPHILWQFAKGWAFLLTMIALVWGMPYIAPRVFEIIWGQHVYVQNPMASQQELFWIFWIFCAFLYFTLWAVCEINWHVARVSYVASPPVNAKIVELAKNIAKRAGLPCAPNLIHGPDKEYVNAYVQSNFMNRCDIIIGKSMISILEEREVEAVLAHEIAHIKHYDTLAYILVEAGTIFFSIFVLVMMTVVCADIFYSFDNGGLYDHMLSVKILVTALLLRSCYILLANAFSCCREYLADAGAVKLIGWDKRNNLATSLLKTSNAHASRGVIFNQGYFGTHPLIINRIRALRATIDLGDNISAQKHD